jgi:hypothetical protein
MSLARIACEKYPFLYSTLPHTHLHSILSVRLGGLATPQLAFFPRAGTNASSFFLVSIARAAGMLARKMSVVPMICQIPSLLP